MLQLETEKLNTNGHDHGVPGETVSRMEIGSRAKIAFAEHCPACVNFTPTLPLAAQLNHARLHLHPIAMQLRHSN